jgi:hypothetical protein
MIQIQQRLTIYPEDKALVEWEEALLTESKQKTLPTKPHPKHTKIKEALHQLEKGQPQGPCSIMTL